MPTIASEELLKDKAVVNEINKHKWYLSEKSGYDIGYEKAARDWITHYAKEYLSQHPVKSTALWIKSSPIYSILNKEIKLIP